MKKKTIVERYEELVPGSIKRLPDVMIYGDGKSNNQFIGLDKIIDDGTNIGTVPKDFYLKNGKLNPKYKSTYPLLKKQADNKPNMPV